MRFRIDDRRWSGTKSDRERFIEMVADWGPVWLFRFTSMPSFI
jgi:hypothetical protein